MLYNLHKMENRIDAGKARETSPKPFDDQITTLLEEIDLAIKWERPSILLAVYNSELVNDQAQEALRKQIELLGQKVKTIKVNKENFDIPWFLAQFEQHEKVVFFVSGFRWGGGRSRTYAYQALNMRRELFVDEKVRLVIWLNEKEASDLPHHAPDFWAFRHRVVEFFESSTTPFNYTVSDVFSWWDWHLDLEPVNINAKIVKRESTLESMPVSDASLFPRINSMFSLAFLYSSKNEHGKAISWLEKALALTSNPMAASMQSKILNGLGILYHDEKKLEVAAAVLQKALEKDPNNSQTWNILGRVFLGLDRKMDAMHAFKKALKLDTKDASTWNNLGNSLREMGKPQDALYAYKQASRLEPNNPYPWINTAHAHMDSGQPDKAIRSYKKTIRLDPKNMHAWKDLGDIYREMNRLEEAIAAYHKGLKIDPNQILLYGGLAACYRMLDRPESVKKQIKLSIPLLREHNEKERSEFEALCGNNLEAIQLLGIALARKQVNARSVRSNPNFNSLHSDPRYQKLMDAYPDPTQ